MTEQNLFRNESNEPFEISLIIHQHINEIEKEIEKEFREVLKNNVINPYDTGTVLYGRNYAFVYIGAKRFKYTIRFTFEVYRINEVKQRGKKYNYAIGKVYVSVKIKGDS